MALKNDILTQTRGKILDRIDPSNDIGDALDRYLEDIAEWIDELPWYLRTVAGMLKAFIAELAARSFKRAYEEFGEEAQ